MIIHYGNVITTIIIMRTLAFQNLQMKLYSKWIYGWDTAAT